MRAPGDRAPPPEGAHSGDRCWQGRSRAIGPGRADSDRVMRLLRPSPSGRPFAEFAVAREDRLLLKPAQLSFVEAAAMPMAGTTSAPGRARSRPARTRTTGPGHWRLGRRRHVRGADCQRARGDGDGGLQHAEPRSRPLHRRRRGDRLRPRRLSRRASDPLRPDRPGGRDALAAGCSRRILTPAGTLVLEQRTRAGSPVVDRILSGASRRRCSCASALLVFAESESHADLAAG